MTALASTLARPGVRFMVASALAFSLMSALVKLLGARLPSEEIVLVRALISLVLSAAVLLRARIPLWGEQRMLLWLRGGVGFVALSCVFYAVSHLPLADATVLQYLHPIFTALLAALFLREALGPRLLGGIALALVGTLLVARPGWLIGGASGLGGGSGAALPTFAVGVALAGAFFSACAYVIVRRLAVREHPLVIVFYFPLVTVPASLPVVLPEWVWPRGLDWLWLAGVGILAQLGQVALTHGMRHEPAGRATALSYLQVAFAALWGLVLFGEVPAAAAWAGAGLILLGAFQVSRP